MEWEKAALGNWQHGRQEGLTMETTNDRLGCNLSGRLANIQRLADGGDDAQVRTELLALLRFFPPSPKGGE